MQPSYQSGFYAPGRGVAKHPELWDGCVGAWDPGLGNTGLSLRDWSGNSNNGTLTGGPTWGVSDGRQALDFDGVDDKIDCGDVQGVDDIGAGGFTFSVWATPDNVTGQATYVSKGGYGTRTGAILFHSSSVLYFKTSNGTQAQITTTAVTGLHHWVGTRSGTTLTLYKDGVSVASVAVTAHDIASADTVQIGHAATGAVNYYYEGGLTDIRIYNRALSPNEIRLLAKRPGIAYELAPRKTYFIQAATSTSQFYDVLSPLIFAGTN